MSIRAYDSSEDELSRSSYAPPDIHLSLNLQILECLRSELGLPQRPFAPCYRTRRRPMAKYAVHTGLAHFMVAFRIDEEAHVRVEVP